MSLFQPFSKTDWDCYGGAEGNAHIGEDVKVSDGNALIIIADGRIEAHFDGDGEAGFALFMPELKAEALLGVANGLFPALAESTLPHGPLLLRFGFEPI